jgi:23S rRNA pseudouridine955/2504/2580 synthase
MEGSILHESDGLLVLNKPARIAVHGGSGCAFGVIEALRVLRPEAPFLELVHRLDRDTSGCLLIAKKRSTLKELHQYMRAREVSKRYLVLVQGKWQGGTRRIDFQLRKNVLRSGEWMVHTDPEGKPAVTVLRPLVRAETASLLEAQAVTGRTHQIRVHAAAIGYPVAGDEKYGSRNFNQELRRYGLQRLFLHALSIVYRDPDTQQMAEIVAPLGMDLQTVLQRLGLADDRSL